MLNKFNAIEPSFGIRRNGRIHIKPHPALQPFIAHYTLYFPPAGADDYLHIIPDASGCFVFSWEDKGLKSYAYGASTEVVTVQHRKSPPLLFVEFLPGGMARLFHWPVEELTDEKILLEGLDQSIEKFVLDTVEGAATLQQLSYAMDAFFLRRLNLMPQQHPVIPSLTSFQKSELYKMTAKELSSHFYYSAKQLNRIFKKHLGIGVKSYCNLLKINRLLQDINNGALYTADLREIAHQYGYYDQAHFNHHFKMVCGVPPTEYLQKLSFFYNEPYKF